MEALRSASCRSLRQDNALKYGGAGLSEILFQYRETNTHHVFFCEGRWGGLGGVDRDKLFQVFQRQATSRGTEESGLGLANVREIAKRHLGDVWVESSHGTGTTFSFSLLNSLEQMVDKIASFPK